MKKTIAILALQGAFAEHEQMFRSLGVETFEVRKLSDWNRPKDGLVIPGGESTVQGKLLHELGLFEPIRQAINDGLPVFGTCAGLILLSDAWLGTMDIDVRRNAYGRQLGSFIKFSENHDLFDNVDEEYLNIAKKYKCPIARRALEKKHLFTSDWAKDTKTINAIRTQCRIESLSALPFNFANRIFSLPHLPQRVINKISDRVFHAQ